MAAAPDQAGPPVRCILKLGGAAITKKNEFETLDENVLTATIQHIVESLRAEGNDKDADQIVIVHGAGKTTHDVCIPQLKLCASTLAEHGLQLAKVEHHL